MARAEERTGRDKIVDRKDEIPVVDQNGIPEARRTSLVRLSAGSASAHLLRCGDHEYVFIRDRSVPGECRSTNSPADEEWSRDSDEWNSVVKDPMRRSMLT